MRKVVIIDGQGGRMGSLLIEMIKEDGMVCEIYAVGTNSIATSTMLKAGADYGATGENPVVVACRDADVIMGPIGIISADSLLGEVTPAMAVAVAQSTAEKILLPVNRCKNYIVGVVETTINELIRMAIVRLKQMFDNQNME